MKMGICRPYFINRLTNADYKGIKWNETFYRFDDTFNTTLVKRAFLTSILFDNANRNKIDKWLEIIEAFIGS